MSQSLLFVAVPTGEQLTWLEAQTKKQEAMILEQRNQNPLIALHGPGPQGAKCKTCAHLRINQCSKRYYKCALRRISNSPATDHKVRWDACGKYVQMAS